MLVVSIVYMKVLWNLQEGSPGKLLKWHFHGDSELLPGDFLNLRTTEKKQGLCPLDNLGFTHPTVQAADPPHFRVEKTCGLPIHQLPNLQVAQGASTSAITTTVDPFSRCTAETLGKAFSLCFGTSRWVSQSNGGWGWTHLVIRLRVRFGSWYIGCNQDFGRFCHTNFRYLKWRYLKPV